jgi:hypothetical protein
VPHAAARPEIEQSAEEHGGNGRAGVAGVHLEASHLIGGEIIPCRPQHRTQGHGEDCGVLPDEAQVGAQEKPGAEAGVILAEDAAHVGKGAAAALAALGHEVVVGGKDQHGEGACQHGNEGAKGTCAGQKFPARHDEAAPPYAAAEGKRPDVERREPSPGLRQGLVCSCMVQHRAKNILIVGPESKARRPALRTGSRTGRLLGSLHRHLYASGREMQFFLLEECR